MAEWIQNQKHLKWNEKKSFPSHSHFTSLLVYNNTFSFQNPLLLAHSTQPRFYSHHCVYSLSLFFSNVKTYLIPLMRFSILNLLLILPPHSLPYSAFNSIPVVCFTTIIVNENLLGVSLRRFNYAVSIVWEQNCFFFYKIFGFSFDASTRIVPYAGNRLRNGIHQFLFFIFLVIIWKYEGDIVLYALGNCNCNWLAFCLYIIFSLCACWSKYI